NNNNNNNNNDNDNENTKVPENESLNVKNQMDYVCSRLCFPFQSNLVNTQHGLLTFFRQLLFQTQDPKVRLERVNVLNQYGCLASSLWRLLFTITFVLLIVNMKEMEGWKQSNEDSYDKYMLIMKTLLSLLFELCKYASTPLELLRSNQMECIWTALLSWWDDNNKNKKNNNNDDDNDDEKRGHEDMNMFAEITQPTLACIILNTLTNCQMFRLRQVYTFIHEKEYISFIIQQMASKRRMSSLTVAIK
ncbi:hypothetical protein RFI_35944, partial [Reticulomyxa filosa]